MRPAEMVIASDSAAVEGWNPGLADAICFASLLPLSGFFSFA